MLIFPLSVLALPFKLSQVKNTSKPSCALPLHTPKFPRTHPWCTNLTHRLKTPVTILITHAATAARIAVTI